jgi:hypothetical protein
MNIGAVFGWMQDAVERRRLLEKLQLPDTGFKITDNGAWCVHSSMSGACCVPAGGLTRAFSHSTH